MHHGDRPLGRPDDVSCTDKRRIAAQAVPASRSLDPFHQACGLELAE